MDLWEYAVVVLEWQGPKKGGWLHAASGLHGLAENLNRMGRDGWIYVDRRESGINMQFMELVFRRPGDLKLTHYPRLTDPVELRRCNSWSLPKEDGGRVLQEE